MTLGKKDIVKKVRDVMELVPKRSRCYRSYDPTYTDYAFNKAQCESAVESLIEIIKESLEKGEDVLLSGFGKFSIKNKRKRKGRNPSTGDSIQLKARRVVTFSYSAKLRGVINNNKV